MSQFIIINIDVLIYLLLGDVFSDASFEVNFILLVVPFVALNQLLSTILLSRNRSEQYGYLNIAFTVMSFVVFGICSIFVKEKEVLYTLFLFKYMCLQIILTAGLLYVCRDVLPGTRNLISIVFMCLLIGGLFHLCGNLFVSDWITLGVTLVIVIVSFIFRGRYHGFI